MANYDACNRSDFSLLHSHLSSLSRRLQVRISPLSTSSIRHQSVCDISLFQQSTTLQPNHERRGGIFLNWDIRCDVIVQQNLSRAPVQVRLVHIICACEVVFTAHLQLTPIILYRFGRYRRFTKMQFLLLLPSEIQNSEVIFKGLASHLVYSP
jgi:hypothetical protein